MIGGKALSEYLPRIQSHPQVRIPLVEQDEILNSHLIEPSLLRVDDFASFFNARRAALLGIISEAMGKLPVSIGGDAPAEDVEDEEEGDD